MKPPGSSSRRLPLAGCSLAGASRGPCRCPAGPVLARAPPCRLLLVLLLPALAASSGPRAWGASAPSALHWNETAEKNLGILANEDNTSQQNSSSNTSSSSAMQKEITLPSRLVYYINQDSESPYHVLDTKARHQQKHSKAVHLAQASFQIEAFGSKFILDLILNKAEYQLQRLSQKEQEEEQQEEEEQEEKQEED
ncbi:Disintegrin and metalloproteinase domain-containing protein 23 [Microtus ochrogaster]|uniref:Disintegrin and metalloproteinase domain-containing protein 23 n=1 Tax=Microtus ochrogaster TaxID=79684 RepID=A0A8J6GBS1_MICOH|nr:Disintegrin and metalloproteinase domain-containing protein 23 [Microtus ochrogaster]